MRSTSSPAILPGVLGRLALGVVEVGGDRDDRLGDLLAEALRGVLRQLAQHERGDLLGRVLLAADLEAHRVVLALDDLVGDDLGLLVDLTPLAPDEALGRVDRRLGVEDRLALRDLADEPLAVLGERDDRRRRAPALRVRDHLGLSTLAGRGHHGVRRSQIDADRPRHEEAPLVAAAFAPRLIDADSSQAVGHLQVESRPSRRSRRMGCLHARRGLPPRSILQRPEERG